MQLAQEPRILVEKITVKSGFLQRDVRVDFYIPTGGEISIDHLLLINDGQDMEKAGLETILDPLYAEGPIDPLICVGIHAGADRRNEYGVAGFPDFKGRGAKAVRYTSFIFEELLPIVKHRFNNDFAKKSFAGFSLGGLSALDIVWNHPGEFSIVGIFSGSLWWRSIDQNDVSYDDHKHRIMHQLIREGKAPKGLKFFFQCGNLDETKDRNQNGIIDSIDDTLDLIKELVEKGYDPNKDIYYLELKDGRHDVPTWARAMPLFLKWGWGRRVGS
jgi:enterochelin esterase-like enzyme